MDYLSLCLICRDENDYLPEWLDYHILMGVDRFYIYDNESKVSLRESLKEYIERGWVVVVDISGKAMQAYAYDHCLQTFGPYTFWMGFIDADEFLVSKATLDLRELLKEYEAYGGLAVSSLFFGSNGHRTRPSVGQIASYTKCAHTTFIENELVKSIVQPRLTLMPNSPHDFTFKVGAWCVNESFLQVDGQRFPNYTNKIQLNHYYCRSEQEIDLKLLRGNSAANVWSRRRFDIVNLMAGIDETIILNNLEAVFQKGVFDSDCLVCATQSTSMLEKMANLARSRCPSLLEMTPPRAALNIRAEFSNMEVLKAQMRLAEDRKDFKELKHLMLLMLQIAPQKINLYVELSVVLLNLGEPEGAWLMLSQAWRLSPNNYLILGGMTFYFLRVDNFKMAETTCRLLLELAPHELFALGMLTYSLLGQERFEEALKVGVPVVELSVQVGELPNRMDIILIKKMADYLLEKKDYAGAVHLWEAGVDCQPNEVNALIELAQALLLARDEIRARQRLVQAQSLAPQNEVVLALLRQVSKNNTSLLDPYDRKLRQ